MRPRAIVFAATVGVVALVGAACGGDSDSSSAQPSSAAQTSTADAEPDEDRLVVEESAEGLLTDDRIAAYLEEASIVPLAESDAAAPAELPTEAGGASGYTRYVFRENTEGEVLTSLVEGPLGTQIRCQDTELPCSYQEIIDLADSDDPIPPELEMTRDELESLAEELRAANAAREHYADPNTACAEGFQSDRTQTPNMGTHFFNYARLADGTFDPAEPEIIMYALADGQAPDGQLGQCEDGVWVGEDLESVAVAYILLNAQAGSDHPEGFTGSLDNWHVHYNLCRGAGADAITTQEKCEAQGATYYPTLGWMMHAWTSERFDNQLGVFSMWNPTVWPASDVEDIKSRQIAEPRDAPDDATFLPIQNFAFDSVEVEAGGSLVVTNSDSVAHTVTEGSADNPTAEFDSGVFAPGEYFEVTFEEPGEYGFFCTLHPDMQATVTVR